MNRSTLLALAFVTLAGHVVRAQTTVLPENASTPANHSLFTLLDSDGDGSLSTAETETAAVLLKQVDLDKDGKVTLQEIQLGLTASVPSGINRRFLDPQLDPEEWINRFEIESREVFAQRKDIVNALNLTDGDDIADIGAGTGLFEGLFSKRVGSQGKVYAVDISPKLLEHLRTRVKSEGMTNVHVVHSKEDSIELAPASVDVVFICDTYHHFEHHPEMLLSIRDALRSKGRLILIDFERIPGKSSEFIMGHVRAGKDVFRREIQRSGFRFVEEVKIPGFAENYFLRFEKP